MAAWRIASSLEESEAAEPEPKTCSCLGTNEHPVSAKPINVMARRLRDMDVHSVLKSVGRNNPVQFRGSILADAAEN